MSIEIIAEVADASGDTATTSIRLLDTTTLAQANGFAVGWLQEVDGIIAGVIRSVLAFLRVDISALTGNLVGTTSDVEHIGKFSFRTGINTKVLVNIPALAEVALGATTSDSLDPVQVNVAAFLTAMEDGINVGGALIEPCDIGEEDIVDHNFLREAFRNSGTRR